ncbi:MAG: hypothetical protein OHK0038_21520 [Flammeovirgaceae bacterium]
MNYLGLMDLIDMKMNKLKLYLIFSIIMLICTACPEYECNNPKYVFRVPVSTTSIKDTLKIGDTLWIEMDVEQSMRDTISKKDISYPNGDFSFIVGITEFNSTDQNGTSNMKEANHLFKDVIINGTFSNFYKNSNCCYYLADFENNHYRFKLGLIPLKKGDYFIKMHGGVERQKIDKCDTSIADIYVSNGNGILDELFTKYNITKTENESVYDDMYGFVVK